MLAAQAYREKNNPGVVWGGFGVATPAVCQANIAKAPKGQVGVCISDDDWSYRSKMYEMEITPEIQSDLDLLNTEAPKILSDILEGMRVLFSDFLRPLPELSEMQDPLTLYEEELA